MKIRLRTKISLYFLLVTIVCMVILNLVVSAVLHPVFIYDSKKQMVEYAKVLEIMHDEENDVVQETMESFYESYLVATSVVSDGIIVKSTSRVTEKKHSDLKRNNRMLDKIEEYNAGKNDGFFEEIDEEAERIKKLWFIYPCDDGCFIVMEKRMNGIEQNIKIISVFLLMCEIIITIIGVILWMITTRSFTKLFEKMTMITKNISELKLDKKIGYDGNDYEIGILAESIDNLSDELSASISSLQDELEEKKVLLRNLSHEIKTPLTTIKGYTENIQIFEQDNPKIQKYCTIMLDECDAMDFLANEMMYAASFDSNERYKKSESMWMSEVFNVAENRVKSDFIEHNIIVNYSNINVYANRELLRSVISNFLDNAVKYSKPQSDILVNGKMEKGGYTISVTNIGDPIPENERELIFKPFYRVDKSRTRNGSHGIGLSFVKQIADLYKAKVGVTCENGKTTFYFTLNDNYVL